jgi:hypothetical protein
LPSVKWDRLSVRSTIFGIALKKLSAIEFVQRWNAEKGFHNWVIEIISGSERLPPFHHFAPDLVVHLSRHTRPNALRI